MKELESKPKQIETIRNILTLFDVLDLFHDDIVNLVQLSSQCSVAVYQNKTNISLQHSHKNQTKIKIKNK